MAGNNYELYIGIEFRNNIRYIKNYSTLNWGEKIAKDYIKDVEQALTNLQTNPYLGKQYDSFLIYKANQHSIIYDIIEEDKFIIALTIMHNMRNIPELVQNSTPFFKQETTFARKLLKNKS